MILCPNFNPIKPHWIAAYIHISIVSTVFIVDLSSMPLYSQCCFPLGHSQSLYQRFPIMSSWNGHLNPICARIKTLSMWYGHSSQNRSPYNGYINHSSKWLMTPRKWLLGGGGYISPWYGLYPNFEGFLIIVLPLYSIITPEWTWTHRIHQIHHAFSLPLSDVLDLGQWR